MAQSHDLDLLHQLANDALALWDLPKGAKASLMNLSENAVYLVTAADGFRAVLRVHRAGYHSRNAIECELAWMDALNREGVVATPPTYTGRNGAVVQTAGTSDEGAPRHLVLFQFVEGETPNETGNLTAKPAGIEKKAVP